MTYAYPSLLDILSGPEQADVVTGSPTLDITASLNTGLTEGIWLMPNNFDAIVCTSANLLLPIGCHIVGPHTIAAGTKDNSSPGDIASYRGKLRIGSSSYSIRITGRASLSGTVIVPSGMTFPQTSSSGWAGTAVTVDPSGTANAADDAAVCNNLIVGFAKAVQSNGSQRGKFYDNNIDCNNGIEITGCTDVCRIENNHCWPFSSNNQGAAANERSGNAYFLHDTVDWAHLAGNFSYGYFRGLYLHNIGNAVVLNQMADGNNYTDHSGLVITGATSECNIQHRSSGNANGAWIGASSGTWNHIEMHVNNAAQYGMVFDGSNHGDFSIDRRITSCGSGDIYNGGSGTLSFRNL